MVDVLNSFGYISVLFLQKNSRKYLKNMGKESGGLIMDDLSINGIDFEEDFFNVVNMSQSLKILDLLDF